MSETGNLAMPCRHMLISLPVQHWQGFAAQQAGLCMRKIMQRANSIQAGVIWLRMLVP